MQVYLLRKKFDGVWVCVLRFCFVWDDFVVILTYTEGLFSLKPHTFRDNE